MMFSPHRRFFRRADTAVTRAASSSLPSYYTGLSHSSVFSSSPSELCVHESLVAAELHVVFQYRDKHPQHRAANRALLHLPVEAGTSELWAPGWLQWPHAGQVTGVGLSRHLFRSGSCKNLGKLGKSSGICSGITLQCWTAPSTAADGTVCSDAGEHSLFPTYAMGGVWESRHFSATGSCCLLLKQELVQNPVGSYKQRGLPGTCFGELFC